jgi:hypothetical protein
MRPRTVYGREYSINLLSKADLDEEEHFAQLSEVRFRLIRLSSFRALTSLSF